MAAPVTPDTAIALEATGHAFPLDDRRADRAGHVTGAPPLWLKHFESGRHSDRVDAEHLAQMLAIGPWPIVFGSRRRRGASSELCSRRGRPAARWLGPGRTGSRARDSGRGGPAPRGRR